MSNLQEIVKIEGRKTQYANYQLNNNQLNQPSTVFGELINVLLDEIFDEVRITIDVLRIKNMVRNYCGINQIYPRNKTELTQIVEIVSKEYREMFTREDYEKIMNAKELYKGER